MKSNIRGQIERLYNRLTFDPTRGLAHNRRLSDIDTRIVVSGVRGKSTLTRWLHEIFVQRGYDTYSKTTGEDPVSLYNGVEYSIERTDRITLYENEHEIKKFSPNDVLILENQGIREYTTRIVNERYVKPHVLVLTNVRQDHLDTLGNDIREIAQSLARSVPRGTRVICADQNEVVADFIEAELAVRDATLSRASIPQGRSNVPGSELPILINEILEAVNEPRITNQQRADYLDQMRINWQILDKGLVYCAASVNDIESTEHVRQALLEKTDGIDVIQPIVYLRRDRPGRTASFIRYLNQLAEHGDIEQARIIGDHLEVFVHKAEFPVIEHDETLETPQQLLDNALADGWPVLLMGNSVPDFMRELHDEIETRGNERSKAKTPNNPFHVGIPR